MKPATRSTCPISCTLDLLGDKWSLLIIRDLLFFEKKSFGEFLLSEEKIARNILADRLDDLLSQGFVVKEVAPANKSKFIYHPTQKAIDLVPLLLELATWSEKHHSLCIPKKEVALFRNKKGKPMHELRKRVRQNKKV